MGFSRGFEEQRKIGTSMSDRRQSVLKDKKLALLERAIVVAGFPSWESFAITVAQPKSPVKICDP